MTERRRLVGSKDLEVMAEYGDEETRLTLRSPLEGPLVLHWGLSREGRWKVPPENLLPPGTEAHGDAVRTPFVPNGDGHQHLELTFPRDAIEKRAVSAVLLRPEQNHWIKNGHADFEFRLTPPPTVRITGPADLQQIAGTIVEKELEKKSWTLMHRYQLAHELLDDAGSNVEALTLIFTWLRYSQIRQLDWQRRYNTKPRSLSHAQERLAERIAELEQVPEARLWARRLLGTIGGSGPGQQVRDDILKLMHRHRLKEVSGTFVEQWHQKLHNNTTPDDIIICDAYLAFVRSGGKLARFDEVLTEGGLTRDDLANYDRAITVDPVMPPHDADAFATDLQEYRGLLASVHSSSDLASAVRRLEGKLPTALEEALEHLVAPVGDDGDALTTLERSALVADASEGLAALLGAEEGATAPVKDLLRLELSLAEHLRTAVEQIRGVALPLAGSLQLLTDVARTVAASHLDPELSYCVAYLVRVVDGFSEQEPLRLLHARAAGERLTRWASGEGAALVAVLDPVGKELGEALRVAAWTRENFAEEVVRGGPLFALSSVLREVTGALRKIAGTGPFQVVSPGEAQGVVRVVDELREIEGEASGPPAVVLARQAGGEEEVPPHARAVITGSDVDLLSHLAVRARNAGVLLASCNDGARFDELAGRGGEALAVRSTPTGQLLVETATDDLAAPLVVPPSATPVALSTPSLEPRVVPLSAFDRSLVGGKSMALKELRGSLPEGVEVPASVALSFGVFEAALAEGFTDHQRQELAQLLAELPGASAPRDPLGRIRQLVASLAPVPALLGDLERQLEQAGIPPLADAEAAWRSIARVWASRWTDRAFFARRAHGLPEAGVRMAVLIQQVVPADFAFVLHSIHPVSKDRGEMLGELVAGLGETLVGNYPGRALTFTVDAASLTPQIVSFPSKSEGLRARGLIFRSDSNAEDLEGFAGAGLHDSIADPEAEAVPFDPSTCELLWNGKQREQLLRRLAELATAIEARRGQPQDIEGAVVGGVLHVVQSRPQVGV